ncbi:glycogen branching protein [Pseudomonas fluvialis]|uniref:Glycogen branching protein n=1 Tax=Pseudomonas fluvialis TaxID=1793966 RepID=A0A2I0CTP7_9PSED|nr:glycogen branching protein [Pseudomonas pharmacofabricae]PKF72672.1 glycogen branching protein [Pseudomonas pharmacofabricae]
MSTIKAEKAFTFREGGKVKVYQKGDDLFGAALTHAQAQGFAAKPKPEKAAAEKPEPEAKAK